MNKEEFKAFIEKQLKDFLESIGPREMEDMGVTAFGAVEKETWLDSFSCHLYDNQ